MVKKAKLDDVSWVTPRIGITNSDTGIKIGRASVFCIVNVAGEILNGHASVYLPLTPYAVGKNYLDFLANWLNYWLKENPGQVIIHSYHGTDRAPLGVVWYLHTHRDMSIEDAYAKVKSVRPQTIERPEWIINGPTPTIAVTAPALATNPESEEIAPDPEDLNLEEESMPSEQDTSFESEDIYFEEYPPNNTNSTAE